MNTPIDLATGLSILAAIAAPLVVHACITFNGLRFDHTSFDGLTWNGLGLVSSVAEVRFTRVETLPEF